MFDLNVDSKFIIKIGQKLHGHAYIPADSTDIQLVSGIAVPYPRFGDVVKVHGTICREEGTPKQIKTVKL